ncbi:class I SAM-dependent methyltransferase [Gellertiella hungarica]|uniref:Ubiquinone/menaquinone biosynthesis C-methylase UbiE n=1 Tax=Gellertiella hungarica TaxID=1572859 RepID=A0A7W6NKL1_9HYPH|nr:class I SAM-dependent methyltransferase [Gellertiella hungarica]MBB4064417.1 ubiquinone/menaquinone biosynthesis C-methylase UbiE [Gellertiella hungarica]
MHEDLLYNDPTLASFYDVENEWMDDSETCFDMAAQAKSVLDLGCGTGLLAVAMAEGGKRRVVGVDPASAMLAIARAREGGQDVTFLEADARSLRLDERFDLITMTGHAFQCMLTREDRLALLRTIAAHLSDKGRFIFDSRNPAAEEWLEWNRDESERVIEHPELGTFLAWNEASLDAATGIVTYETHSRNLIGTRHYEAKSRIAFPDKAELEAILKEAGLKAERWLGDWSGEAWGPDMPEIIPIGKRG